MSTSPIAATLISVLLLMASLSFAEDQPVVVAPREGHFEAKSSVAAKMDYLLFLPLGYESPERNWPLMLYLHGAGECGTNLDLLKRNGPPKYVLSHPDFPFILVSPQTKGGWDLHALMALLDDVVSKYRVERSQIYLTGLSMGGGGAWNLAATHPERFAAVVPVSGIGDPAAARKLATLPIWVFHGAKDPIISVEWSRKMVAAIKAAGGAINYTEYPNARHNIWGNTYDNPELYIWLLAQKRGNR